MATCRGAGQIVRKFSTSAVKNKQVQLPLRLYGLEGRYATALYTAATKENKLDQVESEIKAFQGLVSKDANLAAFLKDPSLQRQSKVSAMTAVVKSLKYSNITSNFFEVLSDNGRLPMSDSVIAAFNKIMAAHRGEVTCTVTVAAPLDAAGQKELSSALNGFLQQGQSLHLTVEVDPDIMGGMTVNFGEKFIDMSTASKIKKYTAVLKESA
ncbi:ATP synthase subunit O, mitochondrial-like [Mya arenaria]|uniref:ATP synthase subunit O, mitochondrial-like n=1 Tax=Mya arenaria TaxID=6604 RepID=UPI0022E681D8|nr:ATP synthase subunit O, mitochondrial-like [Mya arenaria]